MRRKLTHISAALLTCVLIAACGSAATTKTTARKHHAALKVQSGQAKIAVRNFMYMPMRLKVTAGTKITFHNYDGTAHTATADNGSFGTGTIKPGQSKTIVINKPGTYKYHCIFHAFMKAEIVVVKSSQGSNA